MPELTHIEDLLVHCIQDLYSAETQLLDALPKMAGAATDPQLSEAFLTHLAETKGHVKRLEQAADLLGASPHGIECKGMQGLIAEGREVIEMSAPSPIKDLALIGAARKVEHYEAAGYCGAKELAESVGNLEAVALLQSTEDEEKASDKILAALAAMIVGSAPAAGDAVA